VKVAAEVNIEEVDGLINLTSTVSYHLRHCDHVRIKDSVLRLYVQ